MSPGQRVQERFPLLRLNGSHGAVHMRYRITDGIEHENFPHVNGCQEVMRWATYDGRVVVTCRCRPPMSAGPADTVFTELFAAVPVPLINEIINLPNMLHALEVQVSLENMERYFKPWFSALAQTLTLYPAMPSMLPRFPVPATVLATVDWMEACNRISLEFFSQGLPPPCIELMNGSTIRPAASNQVIRGYRGQTAEVDYARDLDDAPTFSEALAALEAWKARRQTA